MGASSRLRLSILLASVLPTVAHLYVSEEILRLKDVDTLKTGDLLLMLTHMLLLAKSWILWDPKLLKLHLLIRSRLRLSLRYILIIIVTVMYLNFILEIKNIILIVLKFSIV